MSEFGKTIYDVSGSSSDHMLNAIYFQRDTKDPDEAVSESFSFKDILLNPKIADQFLKSMLQKGLEDKVVKYLQRFEITLAPAETWKWGDVYEPSDRDPLYEDELSGEMDLEVPLHILQRPIAHIMSEP